MLSVVLSYRVSSYADDCWMFLNVAHFCIALKAKVVPEGLTSLQKILDSREIRAESKHKQAWLLRITSQDKKMAFPFHQNRSSRLAAEHSTSFCALKLKRTAWCVKTTGFRRLLNPKRWIRRFSTHYPYQSTPGSVGEMGSH